MLLRVGLLISSSTASGEGSGGIPSTAIIWGSDNPMLWGAGNYLTWG